jgi:site-specific DNA-cytosine methylase
MSKPLVIDLCCGLGGWTKGFLSEGYDAVGFDIERHQYGDKKYPAQLVLQDITTLHGAQFKGKAAVIVASPPCQAYSYRAMPWKRAKALPPPDDTLFFTCFRIAAEADCPIVVENVKGAQPWVGSAKAHFGPFYLWGDVPTILPMGSCRKQDGDPSWFYANYERSARRFSSHSKERKEWSANIAEIPFDLAQWIARCFKPETVREGVA